MKRFLLIGIALMSISACASTPSAPPTVDVTGAWAGQWGYDNPALGGGNISMTLKQTGADVSGNMNVSGTPIPRTGAVTALVSGNQVRILYPTSITGSLTVQGDTMSGEIDGMNPAKVTLKRTR